MWYLHSEDILSQGQAGFRQSRCTKHQATHLAQEMEDAFQDLLVAFATWIDLQKAFDKVWKDGFCQASKMQDQQQNVPMDYIIL